MPSRSPLLLSLLLLFLFLYQMEASKPSEKVAVETTCVSEPVEKDDDSLSTTTMKTIFLIRHAESQENHRFGCFQNAIKSITKFKTPKSSDVSSALELINVKEQIDSDVSEVGKAQIERMGKLLEQANFATVNNIELVAHSPLKRAKETSWGMLGCIAPDKTSHPVQRVVETDLLKEKTPQEWLPLNQGALIQRMTELESWLNDAPEKNIALVGHSQFFKALLQLNYKFGNCDVWKVEYNGGASTHPEKWSNLSRVYEGVEPLKEVAIE